MNIKELISKLENLAPLDYAMDWDNCGIQVGKKSGNLKKIGIALSPTFEIVQKAIEKGCNILLTHHPLIFKAIKNINTNSPLGKTIELAIKNDLVIYTLHTNFDSISSGLNYTIAKDLGLDNIDLLSTTKTLDKFKLVTYIPEEYTLSVLNAISEEGAGNNYRTEHKSYITSGISTFYDSSSDNEYSPEKFGEDKLEITVDSNKLKNVLETLKEVHPYQNFSYDVYKLEDKSLKVGIGTIGEFLTPFTLKDVVDNVKKILKLKNFTYVGKNDKIINKVAICTGSGGSFLNLAKDKGADLYITGDIKYHTALDAKEIDLALIDAGHHGTEIIAVPFLSKYIKENITTDFEIIELLEEDPFNWV